MFFIGLTAAVNGGGFFKPETMTDPIKLVNHWRESMGLKSNIITPESKRMALHRSLFLEEMNELLYAIDTEDINEIKDGYADLFFVLTGMIRELGENPHDIIERVYKSNMTKICRTESEAIETVLAYKNGTHPNKPGERIETEYKAVPGGVVVVRSEDGKVMKSVNFVEVEW